MVRALIVVAGLLLLAVLGAAAVWLGLYAGRRLREGRWFAAGLALLAALVLLAPAFLVVDALGFALFWQS